LPPRCGCPTGGVGDGAGPSPQTEAEANWKGVVVVSKTTTCLDVAVKPKKQTVGQAVRAFCLACLGADRPAQAFDCISRVCPLYPAHPFRGKPMPKCRNPNPSPQWELDQAEEVHGTRPKRRPSRAMIRKQCEMCLPERKDQEYCEHDECHLFRYCHRRPGGPVKAPRSAKQLAAAGASLRKAQKSPKRDTKSGVLCPSEVAFGSEVQGDV